MIPALAHAFGVDPDVLERLVEAYENPDRLALVEARWQEAGAGNADKGWLIADGRTGRRSMNSKIPMSWEIAKGGRSVNVGSYGKIRMEPGLPSEVIQACMLITAAAPDMLIALKEIVIDLQFSKVKTHQHLVAMARVAIAKAEPNG